MGSLDLGFRPPVSLIECRCGEPIRGAQKHGLPTDYSRPRFCHVCGRPYPWVEEQLRTARDLLDHDDDLSLEDREDLWGDLQYVMSDPKADLVPAKTKLIAIKLKKASAYVRETMLDLLAKIAVESMKNS